jgi:adenylate cyclase
MQDPAFRVWLARRSWAVGVRYCKALVWLVPAAALVIDLPLALSGSSAAAEKLPWLLWWHVAVEVTCLAVVLADRWLPDRHKGEPLLYLFCGIFMALATWVGIVANWLGGTGLAIYAAGTTFMAAVICTPLPVRRPMYALSLLALAVPVWLRTGDAVAVANSLINPVCVVVLCLGLDRFTYSLNLQLYRELQRAEAERARADRVLYNVLPTSVADELKRHDKVNATKFDNMGVLFADIAGFTHFSRSLPPDALVLMLNQIFSAFDALVEREGLEKIKTIGDAYMAVSHQRIDALCALAVAMQEAMDTYNRTNGTALAIRIGIHVGPTVAGVIGVKRFLYDVWGDTVNVASRMESAGEPGAIHVTSQVVQQAGPAFAFREREVVDLKGRGSLQTYWLLGRRAAAKPAVPVPEPSPLALSA